MTEMTHKSQTDQSATAGQCPSCASGTPAGCRDLWRCTGCGWETYGTEFGMIETDVIEDGFTFGDQLCIKCGGFLIKDD